MQILYPKKKFLVLTQKTNFFKKNNNNNNNNDYSTLAHSTKQILTQKFFQPKEKFFSQKENFLMPAPEKNFYNFLEKKFST